jgi:hypothetical protein
MRLHPNTINHAPNRLPVVTQVINRIPASFNWLLDIAQWLFKGIVEIFSYRHVPPAIV